MVLNINCSFLRITYSDLVYVILFPQLLMAVHFPSACNGYGSFAAYVVAIFLRLAGGEELLKLKAFIHYPFYDEGTDDKWEEQRFPFRTVFHKIAFKKSLHKA
jgi:high affinity choline transporter 7